MKTNVFFRKPEAGLSLLAICFAFFSGCVSSAPEAASGPSGTAEANASAMSALEAMDNGGVYTRPPSSGGTSASAPRENAADAGGVETGSPQPLWVRSPSRAYDASLYVAASGSGADRAAAEKNAFANLAGRFGQNIHVEQQIVETYRQAEKNGALQSWSQNTNMDNVVKTSAILDTLLGTEIKDRWFDGSAHYAAAVMDKALARRQYAGLVKNNLSVIDALTSMSAKEKNTLDGYSRYRLAAAIAGMNENFCDVLSYIGNEGTGITPSTLKKGTDYRLEAAEIVKNIPIEVKVSGDKNNRVKSAFSQALGKAGFRTAQNTRYVLDVDLALEPAEFPNQNNKFVYYDITANLRDGGASILPWHIRDRAGHVTAEQAENRALAAAEKKIVDEYGKELSAFLSALIPVKK